jgi:transitional endoplasmic reticulum ATPase
MDSISPKNTRSQYAKQLRSEFLSQLQGIESYGKDTGNILFLICATNKPWDIDSAFLRHGRFGTKIYVGLPDQPAREYMINKRLGKIKAKGIVSVAEDINVAEVAEQTNGFNGADITNLLDHIEEISIFRAMTSGEKTIIKDDFEAALKDIHSSVQTDDLVKLKEWRSENDA